MQGMVDLIERTENLEDEEVQSLQEFAADLTDGSEPTPHGLPSGPGISPARERKLEIEAQRDIELLEEARVVAGPEDAGQNGEGDRE
ncbi:hypothetical protein [Natronococcus jeotgali]|uniref:Uncharacterized protein n=1 Tax=Natronococcus jeotgali DSM 18795 TaxID=1227498 RepID=L9WXK8_9EURY|nr:hypothetical protein [Natronococcus jeotgali]ELY54209.1 hypothetical protein C492_16568 [Natronococcus jeotgali DSM 18795]